MEEEEEEEEEEKEEEQEEEENRRKHIQKWQQTTSGSRQLSVYSKKGSQTQAVNHMS